MKKNAPEISGGTWSSLLPPSKLRDRRLAAKTDRAEASFRGLVELAAAGDRGAVKQLPRAADRFLAACRAELSAYL